MLLIGLWCCPYRSVFNIDRRVSAIDGIPTDMSAVSCVILTFCNYAIFLKHVGKCHCKHSDPSPGRWRGAWQQGLHWSRAGMVLLVRCRRMAEHWGRTSLWSEELLVRQFGNKGRARNVSGGVGTLQEVLPFFLRFISWSSRLTLFYCCSV